MNQVYKTAEVAERLTTGDRPCTPAQIRELKSRYADQLQEGEHWLREGNATLWTETGLEALRILRAGSDQPFYETTLSADEAPTLSADEAPTLSADEDPIAELADHLAEPYLESQLMQRVPAAARRRAAQWLQTLRESPSAQPWGSALPNLFPAPITQAQALPMGDPADTAVSTAEAA